MHTIVTIGAAALLAHALPMTRSACTANTAARGELASASINRADPADSLYKAGRQALNDADFPRAAGIFGELVGRYPRSAYAGDALYWRAFALFHVAQHGGSVHALEDARAALDRQQRDYADAATVHDGKDLRARILAALANRGDSEAARQLAEKAGELESAKGCPSEDDDMRLAALQGFMQMDSENALPILKQVLARRGACTERLRRHAVFLVSQKRGTEATDILLDVARHDPSDEVRGDAVQWLGQTRSERAAAALDSILFQAKDEEIQKKALFAITQQHDAHARQALRRAAEDPRLSEEVRSQAIFWLGQSSHGAEDVQYLRELFSKANSDDMRSHIIQAMANDHSPEASKWLLDIARDKSAPVEARKNAIFWAGQQRTMSFAQLSALFDELRGQEELQKQIIFVLSQRHEAEATDKLMQIARSDPDKEMRKQAIFWLGQKKDLRVTQFLLELINK